MAELIEIPNMPDDWPIARNRPKPVVFLRELGLFAALDPPEEIRRVPFHSGLNIVWADPKVSQARKGGSRLAGHSAGKTTLCRILRWVLGEGHFAPEELEGAVASAFSKGWALLHLELDGNPWVVGRAFWKTRDHRAVCGATLDDVLTTGWPESDSKPEFFAELKRLTIEPLVRQRFPGAEGDIEWNDLLGWLARDQESALQKVEAWRSAATGGREPGPAKAERHTLMRLMLELLDVHEFAEMETCARLESSKETWLKKRPELDASARAACVPLRRIVGADAASLAGPLLVASANRRVAETRADLAALTVRMAALEWRAAEQELETAVATRAKCEQSVEGAKRKVARLEKRVAERDAERIKQKALGLAQARQMPPGFCARSREEASGHCRLYIEVAENILAADALSRIQEHRDKLEAELDDEREELAEAEGRMPFVTEREVQLRQRRDTLSAEREALLATIARYAADLNADDSVLIPARQRQTDLEACETELKNLTDSIRVSREKQRSIREARWRDRNDFAAFYRRALRFLLGPASDGNVAFDSDGCIELTANPQAKISGSAVDALKVIAFDLAAMLWSGSGRSHHPRLLIHDSPRVADMSPVPYGAIFDLAASFGDDANFQYIVTTTEPPPRELRAKYLVLRLDASEEKGHLFKREF